MRTALTLAWRELRGMFLSPTAWIVLAVYLLLGGVFYVSLLQRFATVSALARSRGETDPQVLALLNLNQFVVRTHLWILCLVLLFLLPILTMRLLAEERRSGTAELLLTSPVRGVDLVLGKFLAVLAFVGIAVALSLHYPLFLYTLGEPDSPPILVGFLGLFLAGAAFGAIGLFASSLTESPVVAAVMGLGLLLGLLFVGLSAQNAAPPIRHFLEALSFGPHFQEMAKGVLALSDILYLVSLTLFALFATLRVVESQRWR